MHSAVISQHENIKNLHTSRFETVTLYKAIIKLCGDLKGVHQFYRV